MFISCRKQYSKSGFWNADDYFPVITNSIQSLQSRHQVRAQAYFAPNAL